MDSIHELGSTWVMCWTLDQPLDATARLSIQDDQGTLVHSCYAQSSGTLQNFWQPMVINSEGSFLAEWAGQRTTASSSFPIVERSVFVVRQTRLTSP